MGAAFIFDTHTKRAAPFGTALFVFTISLLPLASLLF